MKKLSKREVNLILFLILIIISLAVVKFFIMPAFKEYKTTLTTIDQYNERVMEINIAKDAIASQRDKVKAIEEEFTLSSQNYYPLKTKKEIHELITNVLLSANIHPTDFSIEEPVAFEVENDTSLIYSSKITIQATGNYAGVKSIIDYFNNTQSIQINNFSIDYVQNVLNDSLDAKLTIELTLFMYDKVAK